MKKVDVLIVGGGVIGLLSALTLAEQGRSVMLVEAGELGRESSWAGGGIVSPLYPWRYNVAVGALSNWSQGYYPELASKLALMTGIDPEVTATGLYWLDLEDEVEALNWAARGGQRISRVDMSEVHARASGLGSSFSSAVHAPDVTNVRNPRLVAALRVALQKAGVQVHEGVSVIQVLRTTDGAVKGVRSTGGEFLARQVVIAAGAWSANLLEPLGFRLPVEPVKGQMILYKQEPGYLDSIVLASRRYAIPRRDGHILVGSTLEHVGFDKTPTSDALASLRKTAEELLPALADAPVVGHWAGLRPGSPEGIPFIGEVPGVEGLWLNCGHYRNGLVMAPASCRLLVDLMLGRAPIVDPAPYSPAGRLG